MILIDIYKTLILRLMIESRWNINERFFMDSLFSPVSFHQNDR